MSTDPTGETFNEGALPRMLDARYRLDAKLGEGGMGVVYVGMNVTIERPVAIKLLRPEYSSNEDVAERFLREARAAVKIRGAHVVEILDFGKSDDGAAFFVMELLEGPSLSELLRREQRLAVRRAVDIAAQICSGLHGAHKQGIVHRDLKPANVVLIEQEDRRDFVKILDFGVAKLLGEAEADLTRTGMLLGTVDYMAPEQIQGQPVDARTDIYALGVLVYRMLTGAKPFTGEGIPAMIYHHISSEPESLRARAPDADIPEALDEVVRCCMAKHPAARFRDMAAVREALLKAVEGVPAAPPSPPEPSDGHDTVHVSVASDWVRDASTYSRHKDELVSAAARHAGRGDPSVPPPLPPAAGRAPDGPPDLEERLDPEDLQAPEVFFRKPRRGRTILAALGAGAVLALVFVLVGPLSDSPTDVERDEAEPAMDQAEGDGDGLKEAALSGGGEDSSADEGRETAETTGGAPEPVEAAAPRPAPIVVHADAPGARVFVGGSLVGPAPATIEPPSFEPLAIRVTARARLPFEQEVVPTTEEVVVRARLQRPRPRPRPRPATTSKEEQKQAPASEETKDVTGDDFFPMDL